MNNQLHDLDLNLINVAHRDRFYLQSDEIYLCTHSLGAMPKVMPELVHAKLTQEWGQEKISAWNSKDWIHLPQRLGAKLAKLLGAGSNEIIVTDNISVNLFKLLVCALDLQKPKKVILTDAGNFPADLYIAQGVRKLLPDVELKILPRHSITENIDQHTAVVMLTHADYRSSELYDLSLLTKIAHDNKALVLIDLAHSAGVLPIALNASGVDMAVGCTYKYLHGGPGAPGFLFVAQKHHDAMHNVISGWMGHKAMFDFNLLYQPAHGISRFLCGTPPVISLLALEVSLEIINQFMRNDLYCRVQLLSNYFIKLIHDHCPTMSLLSPQNALQRGGHVAYAHVKAYSIKQALGREKVICDYRSPNLLRFGFAPLHTTMSEIESCVLILKAILQQKLYNNFSNITKQKVT